MSSGWNHPSFGQFERNGSAFTTTVIVPAFKRFSYDTRYPNARRSTGEVGLTFVPWLSEEELANPTPEMVHIAEKMLANPDKLVDVVAQGLWEEFNGRGSTVGYWWYDKLDTVNRYLSSEKVPPLARPQDVLAALRLSSICIFTKIWDYAAPIGYLEFNAAFEREHGFCVVTDGERFLGSAYSGEPKIGKEGGNKGTPKVVRNPFI